MRAIDFAKFGVLFLNQGRWQGAQVISRDWVAESTQQLLRPNHASYYPNWFSAMPGGGYYQYMWWGMAREKGTANFTAEGDKGQFIYISPPKNLVIVRNDIEDGASWLEWLQLFYQFASQY